MDHPDRPSFGFVQSRLPWLVAAGALALYVLTLNHWVRLDSLVLVAKTTGWDWSPTVQAPLHFLVTYPIRWLPAGWQPLALNLMAALFAALALAWLARSVALLPYDRTREERLREHSEFSLLSLPLAWVPPLVAVLACGLQHTFWDHATADTGEALDLLVLAYVVRGLLEFRLDKDDRRWLRLAFVYGLGVTNNYALIAFFPCALVAMIWVKGLTFFNLRFLGRTALGGLAGLLLYLLLPAVGVGIDAGGEAGPGLIFWDYLRTTWALQKAALLGCPPYIILLLSFTSLLPLLLRAIRLRAGEGETNLASERLGAFTGVVVHLGFLLACLSVFFDPKWSPRGLGQGLALLPFYYLAALAAGSLTGYFLLMSRPLDRRFRPRHAGTPSLAGPVGTGLLALLPLGLAVALVSLNLPKVRERNHTSLRQLAERLAEPLPREGGYALSDDGVSLLLAQAALQPRGARRPPVMIHSRLLERRFYHEQMAKRYPQRWPALPPRDQLADPIDPVYLAGFVANLAQSNDVFYLHPSFGYYFEAAYVQPERLAYRLRPLPTNSLVAPPLTKSSLAESQKFWEQLAPSLSELARTSSEKAGLEARYSRDFYARALNHWGVTLQRQGTRDDVAMAGKWFALAGELAPSNWVAKANLAFNQELSQGPPKPVDLLAKMGPQEERMVWEDVLSQYGPFDAPLWTFRTGRYYWRGALYRQALAEFQRLTDLLPGNATAQLWRDNMRVTAYFSLGDNALAEKLALELRLRSPRDDLVLETLTQIYMVTERYTNALASVEAQLQLDPDNERALLNQGALCIHLKAYEQALRPLDRLLKLKPDESAALMNRAIALLQTGNLDAAQRDYQLLQKKFPKYHAVYFGLGEIAYRRKDLPAARRNYESYLEYAPRDSAERKQITQRVQELKGGAAPR